MKGVRSGSHALVLSWRSVVGGVSILSFVGTVLDLLQPLMPVASIALGILAVLFLILAYLWYQFRCEPALAAKLASVTVAVGITATVACGVVVIQAFTPEGKEHGFLGANNDTIRTLQNKLSGIEATTARLESHIESSADPRQIAQRRLAEEGFQPTNDDYYKALASGYDDAHFRTLGIEGDEASLRRALLAHNGIATGGVYWKFQQLISHMNSQPPGHYAKKLFDEAKAEIHTLADTLHSSRSLNTLYKVSCGTGPAGMGVAFLRKVLSESCANEAKWLDNVPTAISLLPRELQDDTLLTLALDTAAYTFKPINARNVSQSELIAFVNSPTSQSSPLVGAVAQASVDFVIQENHLRILDKTGKTQGFISTSDNNVLWRKLPCNTYNGIGASCHGTITVMWRSNGVQLLYVDASRLISETPADFANRVLTNPGEWKSAKLFRSTGPTMILTDPFQVAAVADAVSKRMFIAYCTSDTLGRTAAINLEIAEKAENSDALLKFVNAHRYAGLNSREFTITLEQTRQLLSGSIYRTNEDVWSIRIPIKLVSLMYNNTRATLRIDAGPTVHLPLVGAREAIGQALMGTACQ